MRLFWFIIIIFIMIVNGIWNSTKKIKLPKNIPNHLQLVYFDNGIGGFWFSAKEKNDHVIICFRGLESFESQEKNVIQLEKIFPTFDIIYLETPGVGISSHVPVTQKSVMEEIYQVYTNIIRYQKWKKIGFVGIEYGAVIQSELYAQCKRQKFILPHWIIQINGFASMNSIVLHRIPFLFQMFIQSNKFESWENYKNTNLPLLLFHSKNNRLAPFVDSVQLYFKLRSNSKCKMIPLYGHEEMTLLSKENLKIIKSAISTLDSACL